MEEFVVSVFLLLVNILLVAAFAPYLNEALINLKAYATPLNVFSSFMKGTASQMLPIQMKW